MALSLLRENAILRKLLVQTTQAYEEQLSYLSKKEQELSWQASHDALTGLINRREFESRTCLLLSHTKIDVSEHAFLYLDLDQFKIVNDTCGHMAGDELLTQVAAELQRHIRDSDTLARLGGDEFGVLLESCPQKQAQIQAEKLCQCIKDYRFYWQGKTFELGVSIGLVMMNEFSNNVAELMSHADIACYMAKDGGRNRIHIYQPNDEELAQRHGEMHWVTRITQAIEQNRFLLYKQQISSLSGLASTHYEVLVRMRDENNNIVLPNAFIPAAERFNLMPTIDRWVIDRTFNYLSRQSHGSATQSQLQFSINLSGTSISEEKFLDYIQARLEFYRVSPENICFEITETAAIHRLSQAKKLIQQLKSIGCRFALDDFGSGLSSFAYLKNMHVDYLKIDGNFVRDIIDDPIDHAMVSAIHQVGKTMGIKTIAEFAENDQIINRLREIGVDYAQGHGVQYPIPLESESSFFS